MNRNKTFKNRSVLIIVVFFFSFILITVDAKNTFAFRSDSVSSMSNIILYKTCYGNTNGNTIRKELR